MSASANGFHRSTLWEGVTREEYERLCTEAQDVLRGKIPNVGQPEPDLMGYGSSVLVEFCVTMSLCSDLPGIKKPQGCSWQEDGQHGT